MKKLLIPLIGLMAMAACQKQINVTDPITVESPTPTEQITKVTLSDKEQGYMSDERSNLETLLEEADLCDVFRSLHPEERSYTWWSNRKNKRALGHGWRLDYFLVSRDLMDAVKDMRHLTDITGSDHCPILLTMGG